MYEDVCTKLGLVVRFQYFMCLGLSWSWSITIRDLDPTSFTSSNNLVLKKNKEKKDTFSVPKFSLDFKILISI